MTPYLTIEKEAHFELTVKKSRFIALVCPSDSRQVAEDKIAAVKKQHFDARHNCSAMVIGADGRFSRFSDDGEPQGTAGIPMLHVLTQSGLTNVLAVVTRYFGGILLGAGGLARAYSSAVSGALKEAQILRMLPCTVYALTLPYASYGKLQAMAEKGGYTLEDAVFETDVSTGILVPAAREEKFLAEVAEVFMGQVSPERKGARYTPQKI
jgi:uncharacterized YigZ family protein